MPRRKATPDPNVLEKSSLEKAATLENLKKTIAEVFMDTQKPEALLRVDAITLRDIQLACCLNSPRMIGQPEDIDYDGETRFLKLVFKMVDVVIRAKKRETTADRVQRFIAGFIQYIQSKGEQYINYELCYRCSLLLIDEEAIKKAKEKKVADSQQPENPDQEMEDVENDANEASEDNTNSQNVEAIDVEEDEEGEEEDYETITSRFVESFLRHLFRGFNDSKAAVRFRCCQLLALSLSSMGELE